MKRGLIILFSLFIGAVLFFLLPRSNPLPQHQRATIQLNNHTLTLEIVTSTQDIQQGLSDRRSMPIDQGMLFVFDHPDRYSFWMQRMHFPLDIIWLNQGVVVDRVTLLSPNGNEEPASHIPTSTADRVLELNAGRATFYQLQIGSTISLP